MDTFKITNIDKDSGHVSVVYSVDQLEQTMGGCPIDDVEALKAFLEDYGRRYAEAQSIEAVIIPKEIDKLVGKTFDIPEFKEK